MAQLPPSERRQFFLVILLAAGKILAILVTAEKNQNVGYLFYSRQAKNLVTLLAAGKNFRSLFSPPTIFFGHSAICSPKVL